jgi:phosphoribosyl-AMP cyclohydrolase
MKVPVLLPNFKKRGGLVTVVAQDVFSLEVLMVAFTDKAGFLETLATGNAVYFSTSRNKRWKKGEESGDVQKVTRVLIDCDGDALIYLVQQMGDGACHTKAKTCFYRSVKNGTEVVMAPKAGDKEKLDSVKTEVHKDIAL